MLQPTSAMHFSLKTYTSHTLAQDLRMQLIWIIDTIQFRVSSAAHLSLNPFLALNIPNNHAAAPASFAVSQNRYKKS